MELKQLMSEIEVVSRNIAYYEKQLKPLVQERDRLLGAFVTILESAMEKNEIEIKEPKFQTKIGYGNVLTINVNLIRKKVDLIKIETLNDLSEIFPKTLETE